MRHLDNTFFCFPPVIVVMRVATTTPRPANANPFRIHTYESCVRNSFIFHTYEALMQEYQNTAL